jgi:hypothetical protein
MNYQDIPVLLINFNRPHLTQSNLERLKAIGVKNIYIFRDGPRKNVSEDLEKINEVERIIEYQSRNFNLKKLLLNENLGCRYGVHTAISWFFKNEAFGVILEDDIVIDHDFLKFCYKYRNINQQHTRIGAISASRFIQRKKYSFISLGTYPIMWGWATWANVWDGFDIDKDVNIDDLLEQFRSKPIVGMYWKELARLMNLRKIDTWDYSFIFYFMRGGFLTLRNASNLSVNVGYGLDATHTKGAGKLFKNLSIDIYDENSDDIELKYNESVDREDEIYWLGLTARKKLEILLFYFNATLSSHKNKLVYILRELSLFRYKSIFRKIFTRIGGGFGSKFITNRIFSSNEIAERFKMIYEYNYWDSTESVSGEGSTLKATQNLRKDLSKFIVDYKIKTIVDVPCGDYNWMRDVVATHNLKYIGIDIVGDLINRNNQRFASRSVEFIEMDCTKDRIPSGQLVFCRDLMFHLSYHDCRRFLLNLAKSEFEYFATTSHHPSELFSNTNIETGDFRKIDLFSCPFNFPKNIVAVLNDSYLQSAPRGIYIWRKNDLFSKIDDILDI